MKCPACKSRMHVSETYRKCLVCGHAQVKPLGSLTWVVVKDDVQSTPKGGDTNGR
jgi:ribosomal protein S27E